MPFQPTCDATAGSAAADDVVVNPLQSATVDAFQDSLRRHMPAGPLRDYYGRGLDETQPRHAAFLQATGVTQLVKLYTSLTSGLVDEALWPKVSELLARIVVYQAYEIVSDNLAFGLAAADPEDAQSAAARRQLLRTFNTAMTVRLRGSGRTAAVLLSPERRRAGRFSTLEQSLAGATHRALAGPGLVDDVEHGVWPALVANIEAAVDLVGVLEGTSTGPLVRDGLANRYKAVTRTLSPHHLSRLDLAAVGAHTSLVVPTLAYCVGVVSDLAHPAPGLADAAADGTLDNVLHDAALLARLLNDVGPGLLEATAAQRHAALGRLRRQAAATVDALVLAGPLFARLGKDLAHGEFNILLYGARRAPDVATALERLESDLSYFARLYALHAEELAAGLERLTARVGDHRPAALIERFVAFHAALYANRYDEAAGEYAV